MKLACIGDSLTECRVLSEKMRWPAKLGEKLGIKCVNFGIAGDTTGGMLGRCQRELMKEEYTHCFLMGGTNDIWYGATWRQTLPNVFAMVRQAQFLKIQPIIGLVPLFVLPDPQNDPYELFPPVDGYDSFVEKMQEYREILIKFCHSENLPCVDVYTGMMDKISGERVDPSLFLEDGLHFNELGCEMVSDCVAQKCRELKIQ